MPNCSARLVQVKKAADIVVNELEQNLGLVYLSFFSRDHDMK
jgi:hypothetical protein